MQNPDQGLKDENDMARLLVMLANSGNHRCGSLHQELTNESHEQPKSKVSRTPSLKSESDSNLTSFDDLFRNKNHGKSSILRNASMEDSDYTAAGLDVDTASANADSDERSEDNHKPRKIYKCNKCSKVFSCHQALGGHKASHRKVKVSSSSSNRQVSEKGKLGNDGFSMGHDSGGLVIQSSLRLVSPSAKGTSDHECAVCHKVFQSGQALGGHKRCHKISTKLPLDNDSISIRMHPPKIARREIVLPDLNQPITWDAAGA